MHRALCLLVVLATALPGTSLVAQRLPDGRPVTRDRLPRAVAREVARLYAEPHALRAAERTEIAAGRTVEGNVAVIDGPLTIAGRVTGRVLAINSDVQLRPGARIDGDLLVVGGEIDGQRDADIAGEIRVYRQSLVFTRDGDRLVVPDSVADADEDGWWRRWERRRPPNARSRIVVASAGAYNRVEGLPINVGPSLQFREPWGRVSLDLFAVLRTGASFQDGSSASNRATNDVGHSLRLELRGGRRAGGTVGARLYNVVAPVEDWQLTPLEYGLAAFLFRRDYRDLYARHGAQGYAGLFRSGLGDVTVGLAHERWTAQQAGDPTSLLRNDLPWRPNPQLDAGTMHLLTVGTRFDTRNDDDRPWSGWLVRADIEHGRGDVDEAGPVLNIVRGGGGAGRIAYTRGFLDARRYNRVGPGAQLNFRLVAGGWLGGDPLPLQRRLSVSGPGALPGFDFRTPIGPGFDVATCNDGPAVRGTPALCDRIALGQAEYRGDLHFDPFGGFDWSDGDQHSRNDAVWVVFVDAGRGWLVGPRDRSARYARDEAPPLSTFRSDLGFGIDLGEFGVFVAKGLSDTTEPVNFLVRLRHRF